MVKKIKLIEKLSGAYDKLSSRTNSYHNGGTASEGLCTDLEYPFGLDNRGEMVGIVGIGLLIALIILALGVSIIKVIPDQDFANIGKIAVLGICCLVIIAFGCLSQKLWH